MSPTITFDVLAKMDVDTGQETAGQCILVMYYI